MECTDPKLGKFVRAYHLGDILKPKDRTAFAAHVLVCDFCWKTVKKLQREEPKTDQP
ncbi:MAG: hypothetical protein KW802_01240 [Candidatus Doudnabacteria bacterium]|nr:hypothetical protein [Candidatus Doudnabacteria bacterium]